LLEGTDGSSHRNSGGGHKRNRDKHLVDVKRATSHRDNVPQTAIARGVHLSDDDTDQAARQADLKATD
jgi:hypothetical protein